MSYSVASAVEAISCDALRLDDGRGDGAVKAWLGLIKRAITLHNKATIVLSRFQMCKGRNRATTTGRAIRVSSRGLSAVDFETSELLKH